MAVERRARQRHRLRPRGRHRPDHLEVTPGAVRAAFGAGPGPGACSWRGRRRPTPAARRRAGRRRDHRRRRWPGCGGCRSPTSASPGWTTTGPCARGWPRRSTARARRPSSAPPSWPSCWPSPGRAPVLLTRADDDQAAAALARNPGGERTGTTLAWRPSRAPARDAWSSPPPAPPTCRWPTSARPRWPPTASTRSGSPTWAWPACTACWPRPTCWPTPTRSWWWRAWRAPWPAWSAASPPAPVVAVPTSAGYGAASRASPPCSAMLASCAAGVTVVGIDNGFGAACAVLRMLK